MSDSLNNQKLEKIDHVAIVVDNIAVSAKWYQSQFNCQIEYIDKTWALLKFANICLALVLKIQHPGHICFIKANAAQFGSLTTHRDGTKSVYLSDPSGNTIEIMDKS